MISNYFEQLYQPLDTNEKREMEKLESNIYIPMTDDPITGKEIHDAYSDMKKGGYDDFSLPVLKMLVTGFLAILLLLLNLVFYVSYPLKFGISLLCAIPKKGNLKLLTNYRGIHMQNMLSLLYDRITANRLTLWAKVHYEQTAFQKGKSTLDQIFLLRTIISLIRQAKLTLYIGYFDLEKAFDKVSTPMLLMSLIKLGIGASLLFAIKAMYSSTKLILKSGKKLSDIIQYHSGIKQGAPSSVIFFIIFMDEFIDIIREKCVSENIIGVQHLFLHTDDTIVLSTERNLFIEKCKILIDAFTNKKVAMNLRKSGFLIINPKYSADRVDVKLNNGWLSYKSSFVYLGTIFWDNGTIYNDINLQADAKSKSVYIKLANFIRNNPHAPITVKRKILTSCLNAALLYGCETWGGLSIHKVEHCLGKQLK